MSAGTRGGGNEPPQIHFDRWHSCSWRVVKQAYRFHVVMILTRLRAWGSDPNSWLIGSRKHDREGFERALQIAKPSVDLCFRELGWGCVCLGKKGSSKMVGN
jgi:hypothetical protein